MGVVHEQHPGSRRTRVAEDTGLLPVSTPASEPGAGATGSHTTQETSGSPRWDEGVWGDCAGGPLPRARPCQPDRRAHRLRGWARAPRRDRPRPHRRLRARGPHPPALGACARQVDVAADGAGVARGFGRYVAALAIELADLGRAPAGIDGRIAADLPAGAGLASSAALLVAVGLALCDAAGMELPPMALAGACRRAEERAVGVPCGIMDPAVSLLGRAGMPSSSTAARSPIGTCLCPTGSA